MKCIHCNVEMIESTKEREIDLLTVSNYGMPSYIRVINVGVKKPTLFSNGDEVKEAHLNCRICPNCGMVERYISQHELQELFR